jgi:glycosyltransferase involved in cell wall biosynthesis
MKSVSDFTVVLPVYKGDSGELFKFALNSLLKQTVLPNEIILVADGEINGDVDEFISNSEEENDLVKAIRLKQNEGAGPARHRGIMASKNELIALMDADDIAFPFRFERQLAVFAGMEVDFVGGLIVEVVDGLKGQSAVRRVPKLHDEILKYSKWRNPVNNVTAMFKKDIYLRAGGFKPRPYFEDWDLWTRALMAGGQFYNIQEPLVQVTGGDALMKRRRGIGYRKSEIEFLKFLKSTGFINTVTFWVSVFIRTTIRYLPAKIVGFVYSKILRSKR